MKMLGEKAEAIKVAGGHLVGRPDSGDPVQCVVSGLQIFARSFGYTEVDGLKLLQNAGVIQADGINDSDIFDRILPAVVAAGFSPLNVSFGMGESNHRVNRSDLESALKTSLVGVSGSDSESGTVSAYREVMKESSNRFKRSIPGAVSIHLNAGPGESRVRRISVEELKAGRVGGL